MGGTLIKDNLLKSYYEAKMLMLKLELEAKKINWCVDGDLLYYDNDLVKRIVRYLNANSVESQSTMFVNLENVIIDSSL